MKGLQFCKFKVYQVRVSWISSASPVKFVCRRLQYEIQDTLRTRSKDEWAAKASPKPKPAPPSRRRRPKRRRPPAQLTKLPKRPRLRRRRRKPLPWPLTRSGSRSRRSASVSRTRKTKRSASARRSGQINHYCVNHGVNHVVIHNHMYRSQYIFR